jgi:hypothetical protein
MGMLKNPKDEAFANYMLTESTATAAYYKAYPQAKNWKVETVHNKAAAKARSSEIVARIEELKAELASKCLWTREQSVEVLKEIATRQGDEEKKTLPSKDADRIASIKELNAMHGFNAPIEHDVNFKGKHTVVKQYVKMDDVDAD